MSVGDDRRRLTFDPTINAGHVLTFVGFLVTIGLSYSILDKRVGVLEEKALSASSQQTERQAEQKESLKEIKVDIKDLQRSVNEIGRALASKRP